VATILILNNFLLKRIWRPFYHLLKQLKNFRLEKPSTFTIQKTKIDEFRLLNEAVQKLLQTNIDSYSSQKHFIENASHELQTPLAIGINKLEALAETNTLSEKQLHLLASALDNLERLTRLNRSLLLLSKIENKQFLEEQDIQLNELVKKISDDFSDQLTFSGLALTIDNVEESSITMNPDLALILFTNLVKNAIVHNHPGGYIRIEITRDSMRIENTGRDQALNQQKLFTRFNREQQSETSTGLGLAIVKAITDLYSYVISYSFTDRHIISILFR
jgi:signal transduction histidine kinase